MRTTTTHMPHLSGERLLVLSLAILALAVTGCAMQASGETGVAGLFQRLRPLEKRCAGPLNGGFAWDFSANARGSAIFDARLEQLHDFTDQVAACGGYVKVYAFSSSATDTATLGEQSFPTKYGTDNARLIHARGLEDHLIAQVKSNLKAASTEVAASATDVLAQFMLAQQFQQQRGGGTLYFELASDAIATYGPVQMGNAKTFTDDAAKAAAVSVALPNLKGAWVRMAGVGKTAGTGRQQPSTRWTKALLDFYSIACHRMQAARCEITTDYTNGG